MSDKVEVRTKTYGQFHTHQGRVAVVTGAAQGFGQFICKGLAERGATVVAVDINEPVETVALLESAGHQVVGLRADVSNPEQTARVGTIVADTYGRCDILVNNAGIFPNLLFDDMNFTEWRKVLSVNLDSQFLMVKALLPLMKLNSWGRIVNVASGAPWLSLTGITHYASSKMGAIGFTRGLSNEVGAFGITVNAICPACCATPGVVESVPAELIQAVAQQQAIKHVGDSDAMTGTVLFLTSEDSDFITGQTIMVDGGLNKL